MSTASRLAAYALALVAVFTVSLTVGAAVGPIGTVAPASVPAGHDDGRPAHQETPR